MRLLRLVRTPQKWAIAGRENWSSKRLNCLQNLFLYCNKENFFVQKELYYTYTYTDDPYQLHSKLAKYQSLLNEWASECCSDSKKSSEQHLEIEFKAPNSLILKFHDLDHSARDDGRFIYPVKLSKKLFLQAPKLEIFVCNSAEEVQFEYSDSIKRVDCEYPDFNLPEKFSNLEVLECRDSNFFVQRPD